MLLVAQHVRAPTAEEGINVAVYVHARDASLALARAPQLAFGQVPLPAALALTVTTVAQPGSAVLSYLDVAFPDALPSRVAVALLERTVLDWQPQLALWGRPPMAARLNVAADLDPTNELRALKTSLLPVLGSVVPQRRGEDTVWTRPPQPVRVVQQRRSHGHRFTLDPPDRRTLTQLLGVELPAAVAIADDTRDAYLAFAAIPLGQAVVEALTGVPLGGLEAFGGAEVVDERTGDIVWRST